MGVPKPFRALARHTPAPLDGLVELYGGIASDWVDLATDGLQGDDLDAWDPDYIRATLPLLRATFGRYFRGEVRGLENVPDGPSLMVGNHSGGLMIADTFILSNEFYEYFGPERRFHQLAHDFAARNPGLGMLRRFGTIAASHSNAERAFERGAPVLVYPGGDFETFRPSWHSNQIEFGGRRGFVRLAIQQGVPIVPVVAVGGQETALFLTRGQRAAKLLQLDRIARIKVLPVSIGPPFGVNFLDLPGRIPLPSKITIEVLPPIRLERYGSDPDHEQIYDEVTGEMQEALDSLSDERSIPLVG